MIVIIFNPIGAAMCFVPAVIESFILASLPTTGPYVWILIGAWGLVTFVWDALYRIFNRDEHWLSPNRGGHIFFIPVCFLGLWALWLYVHHSMASRYWLPHQSLT